MVEECQGYRPNKEDVNLTKNGWPLEARTTMACKLRIVWLVLKSKHVSCASEQQWTCNRAIMNIGVHKSYLPTCSL